MDIDGDTMLYTDFFFRMKRRDAICVAGWTMGPITDGALVMGEQRFPASVALGFLRGDLPHGATGFIMRFELGGEIIDIENTKLRLEGPARTAAFPAASANLEALIATATDELFMALMVGTMEGLFTIEDGSAQANLHKRAIAMAANRGYADVPAAAVAADSAMIFANPQRILVSGWMGDDGQGSGTSAKAAVLDGAGTLPLALYRDSLIRPDLAGVQIRNLNLGAASGYVGALRAPRKLGPNPVVMVGMIHDGMAMGTLRLAQPMGQAELGRQFDALRRNTAQAHRLDEILTHLLPDLPNHADPEAARPVTRPAKLSGLAYVIEHDLDHWVARDVLRFLRKPEAAATQIALITEGASEGVIRASIADASEAGPAGPKVELWGTNSALATWAPEAQHLIATTSALLFQVDGFDILAKARADLLPALCLVLTDRIEPGIEPISAEEGIEALLSGLPFLGQIDQAALDPMVLPQSLHLSQMAQMRWLLVSLAQAGMVTFVAGSGLGFLSGRDPIPVQNRLIELRAMRLAAQETAL